MVCRHFKQVVGVNELTSVAVIDDADADGLLGILPEVKELDRITRYEPTNKVRSGRNRRR
jgi:hypothetical protein